jgi:hypothetical protein
VDNRVVRQAVIAVGAIIFVLIAVSLMADDESPKPPPIVQPLPAPPRDGGESPSFGEKTSGPPPEAKRIARVFAKDYLDFVAGKRPPTAWRGASPALIENMAGASGSEEGEGAKGLRRVRLNCNGDPVDTCMVRLQADGVAPLRFRIKDIAGEWMATDVLSAGEGKPL